MLGGILWTILGVIGLMVLLVLLVIFVVIYKVRHNLRSLVKTYDHHPIPRPRKDVTPTKSETINK